MRWLSRRIGDRIPAVKALNRRHLLMGGLVALAAPTVPLARAAELRFLQIGTGPPSGSYFPMGGLVAAGISRPFGSRPCSEGGSCGVEGMIAVASSTQGAVENVGSIERGDLDSCLSQADVAAWAYLGAEAFGDKWAHESLRAVANLYPESVHVAVRRNAGVFRMEDLKGMRVAIGPEGSGTRVDALMILAAYGLGPQNMDLVDWQVEEAGDFLRSGHLDGFFFITGAPAPVVTQLAQESLISLLPLTGPAVDELVAANPFFRPQRIESGTYFNVSSTETLAVNCQWLVSAELPNEQVYQMTRSFWDERVQSHMRHGHPLGALLSLRTALDEVAAPPLHEGANRFYREIGMIG